jgi:hypothetical protein
MYVRSGKDAQHMINMREKPDAFVVIFDSTQPLGKGDGLYVQCAAQELSTQEEVQHALTCMELRGAKSVDAAMFIGEGSKRIVKLVPQTAWRNVITVTEAGYRDTREEVAIV